MPGVGTLLKQAQKMQKQIESLQATLALRELDVTSGGGAVKVKITGSGQFRGLELDPEFLKEDAKLVADAILAAVQEASTKAKDLHDAEMKRVSGGIPNAGHVLMSA